MDDMYASILELEKALLHINRVKAEEIVRCIYKGPENLHALENLMIGTLEKMGTAWENGEVSLAQEYMASIICEDLIEKYLPLSECPRKNVPKMAIGVLKDHHGLGKRMVYAVLRAAGFELLDFGLALSVDEMVHKTIDSQVEILLISTLMYPSALKVAEVKGQLDAAGAGTKIIVGGAPFRLDAELWKTVNADATGRDASEIVGIIEEMVRENNG